LLRHGLVFLRGRLTPIGRRVMPIPKVRREGSAVSQVCPGPVLKNPVTTWKAMAHDMHLPRGIIPI